MGKFVEFYGPGLDYLGLADRATIANMAPEYGATCGFFPVDRETIEFLRFTGREAGRVRLVEEYAKAQGMWRGEDSPDPHFSKTLHLNMGEVVSCLAGHKRPQDRIPLEEAKGAFREVLGEILGFPRFARKKSRGAITGSPTGMWPSPPSPVVPIPPIPR